MSQQRISHYEIEKTLGEGAMGRVFLARDVNLDRMVALKMVHGALGDKGFHDRFRREARLAASLNHPHIATIYEFGEAEGESYLAMELVEGETLQERLRHGPLSAPEVRRLGAQAASALAAAHARGIVHRDIKPANLMITSSGDLKVMDFGVARRSGDTQLTMDGALVGTANIMAPETIEGGESTPASDLFSLGCVLYEALSGRAAFPGQSIVTVLHQVMNRDAQPLAELAPDVPPDLVDLIHGLLRKDPAQRFGPAEAVARALTEKTGATGGGGDAGTMVIPPAGGTMVMPGAAAGSETSAGFGAPSGTGAGTGHGTAPGGAAGGARAPGTVSGAPSAETAPSPGRRPLWRRRAVWLTAAAVAVALLIKVGMDFERGQSGGADRVRAETLNDRGLETMSVLRNQAVPDPNLVKQVRDLLEDAAAADTTYAVPRNNLGKLAQITLQKDVARNEYRAALMLDPTYAAAYVNLAELLESDSEFQDAEAMYRSAIQNDRSDSLEVRQVAANNLAYMLLGQPGRAADALTLLEPEVKRFPRNLALAKNYGMALLAVGRFREGEDALAQVVAANARYYAARAGFVVAAEARGDTTAAAERWEALVADMGPDPAREQRAIARLRAGVDGLTVPSPER